MKVEQFVLAYGVEQDRLRAILPEGFCSLRPVLRFNAEIYRGETARIEFNTAVEHDGLRGWLNIGSRENVAFSYSDGEAVFETDRLLLKFKKSGGKGSCPAEKDNAGCMFIGEPVRLRPPERITAEKEFCDAEFEWLFASGTRGVSMRKTLPAIPSECKIKYKKQAFSVENVAAIPCEQVLGAYAVEFTRMNMD